jgi:hypothetical protein
MDAIACPGPRALPQASDSTAPLGCAGQGRCGVDAQNGFSVCQVSEAGYELVRYVPRAGPAGDHLGSITLGRRQQYSP